MLTACVQCHVKPFNSGDFRRQLQDAMLEMRLTVAPDHPLLASLPNMLFDLNLDPGPEHTLEYLWDLALDMKFLKGEASGVYLRFVRAIPQPPYVTNEPGLPLIDSRTAPNLPELAPSSHPAPQPPQTRTAPDVPDRPGPHRTAISQGANLT